MIDDGRSGAGETPTGFREIGFLAIDERIGIRLGLAVTLISLRTAEGKFCTGCRTRNGRARTRLRAGICSTGRWRSHFSFKVSAFPMRQSPAAVGPRGV